MAVAIACVLAACAPSFATGSALVATPSGSGAVLSWSAATASTDRTIATYRIDVDGTEVARLPASELGCRLHGLGTGPHTVSVTAYDSAGEWSGSLTSGGRLEALFTAPAPIPADYSSTDPRTPPGCVGSMAGSYTGSGERYECDEWDGYPEMTVCGVHTPVSPVAFQLAGPCDGIGPCGLSTEPESFLFDAVDEVCGQPDGSGYWFSFYYYAINGYLLLRVTANETAGGTQFRAKASVATYLGGIHAHEVVEDSTGTRTSTAPTTTGC